ncbi:MAG: hypothetical protein HYR85_12335 [Planctomycetes bacterium]|nr:hypothetical protein [Planctomycetota bacterium]
MKPSTLLALGAIGALGLAVSGLLPSIWQIGSLAYLFVGYGAIALTSAGFFGYRPVSGRPLALAAGISLLSLAAISVLALVSVMQPRVVFAPVGGGGSHLERSDFFDLLTELAVFLMYGAMILCALTLIATRPIRHGLGRWVGIGLLSLPAWGALMILGQWAGFLRMPPPRWINLAVMGVFSASLIGLAWKFFEVRRLQSAALA